MNPDVSVRKSYKRIQREVVGKANWGHSTTRKMQQNKFKIRNCFAKF